MIMLVSGYQVLKRNYQRSLFMSQNVRLQAAQFQLFYSLTLLIWWKIQLRLMRTVFWKVKGELL